MSEVLIAYKSSYGIDYSPDYIHSSKSSFVLRRSLENVLRQRQVKAFMVDEAHHLLMMAGGHQMLQQMNADFVDCKYYEHRSCLIWYLRTA